MNDGSGLSANVRLVNPPKLDVNGATILSDAPAPILLRCALGSSVIIDTQGYSSLNISFGAMSGTVSAGDDLGSTFIALNGINRAIATATTSAFTPNTGWSYPCVARYIKILANAAAGTATAYLRSAPWVGNSYLSSLPVANTQTGTATQNIAQINGVAPATMSVLNAAVSALPVASPILSSTSQGATSTVTGVTVDAAIYGGVIGGVFSVSAASGTTPTADFVLQESYDNGTTYVDIYHFERFTTTGTVVMPTIPTNGKRRMSFTIGGTTPSFTWAFNYVAGLANTYPTFRQFFDRTAGLLAGTASATSSTYTVAGCNRITASITIGAATTGGIYKLQGSNDGTNWYDLSATVTAVANSTVQASNTTGAVARFARLFVSTGATAQTGTVTSIIGTN
jgi:hypothetical protein